jgi:hypothetical protein
MRYDHQQADDTVTNTLQAYLNTVNAKHYRQHPHQLRIMGGQIERWLDDKNAPVRAALVWNNRFFGKRAKRSPKYAVWSSFVNAPVHRYWAQDSALRAQLIEYVKFE